jgi:type III secretory pathway component EscT
MNLETAKEARSFARMLLVFSGLLTILTVLSVYMDNELPGIIPIRAGILLAIGITLLPKANKKIKQFNSENNESKIR